LSSAKPLRLPNDHPAAFALALVKGERELITFLGHGVIAMDKLLDAAKPGAMAISTVIIDCYNNH
jgi:hypothetical protein